MNAISNFDPCVSFLNSQLKPSAREPAKAGQKFRTVTFSRQTGSGANSVANLLVARLNNNVRRPTPEWTAFDRDLVEKVLADHQLPARLAKYFPEDRLSQIQDAMDGVLGLRPESCTLVEQSSETILRLAKLGNVILVGRGANIITREVPDALHVRLVGSVETRVRRLAENRGMTRAFALAMIEKEDLGRRRYLKRYFGADIDDPLLYHLTVNTDFVSVEETVELLARIVVKGF